MTLRNFSMSIAFGAALLAACSSTPPPVEVTLRATDFRYEPAAVEVLAGQQLAVNMENMGTLEHDFVIQEIPVEATAAESESDDEGMAANTMDETEVEPAVHMGATAGMSSSVTFIPTKPGTYEFFCAVPGHKEAGMTGTLTVRER